MTRRRWFWLAVAISLPASAALVAVIRDLRRPILPIKFDTARSTS